MFNLIRKLFSAKRQYERIIYFTPEKRDSTIKLGVQSIILSTIGSIFIILSMILACFCLNNIFESKLSDGTYNYPIFSLFGVIFGIGAAFGFLTQVLVGGLSFSLYQLQLNKKVIGKTSLIICILCLIISLGASILLLVITFK